WLSALPLTLTLPASRLTSTDSTPATAVRASVTCLTQWAQVISLTFSWMLTGTISSMVWMATVSTLTPWQSQLLLNFPVWLSSDCKAGELGWTCSHAENDQEGENNMNEYEEELLEQRAQEWDDAVDDAQEM